MVPTSRHSLFAATELQNVVLLYEVDPDSLLKGQKVNLDELVTTIKRRVNPAGNDEILVRPGATERIEIIISKIEKEKLEHLKRLIVWSGSLEFRVLASEHANKDLAEQAKANPDKMQLFDDHHNLLAWWTPVEKEHKEITRYSDVIHRTRKTPQGEIMEILVLKDDNDVTGAFITQAKAGVDSQGRPCVQLNFNQEGGQRFCELTKSHSPDDQTGFAYKLAIILDGQIVGAPMIRAIISDRAEITGHFTQEEVQALVYVLNSGSLPAKLRLVSKEEPARESGK